MLCVLALTGINSSWLVHAFVLADAARLWAEQVAASLCDEVGVRIAAYLRRQYAVGDASVHWWVLSISVRYIRLMVSWS